MEPNILGITMIGLPFQNLVVFFYVETKALNISVPFGFLKLGRESTGVINEFEHPQNYNRWSNFTKS